jgi:hypothetical protein
MKRLALDLTRNPLGLAGAALATVCGILILTLAALGMVGFRGGPYLGIAAFLVLPAFFVLGLVLIPVGAWLARRRAQRAAERGEAEPLLPVIDLNQPRTRRLALVLVALTAVNLVIVALATYKGVQVMDSPGFCGSCHSVMDPEFTTYQRSPHARVACVECHIGPGAPWFVKSKLSGAWQLVSVTFGLYSRPIQTPVHDLRPARDTCEHCHWPTKFVGNRLKVKIRHDDDAPNTEKKTVLLLRIGGAEGSRVEGIHWHVHPGVQVRYLADPKRETIGTVELTLPDGARRTYRAKSGPSAPGPASAWRTMDCVDCHNRPTHIYAAPEDEVDGALNSGRIDRSLPFVRREGLRLLKAVYPSHAAARQGIQKGLLDFYEKSDPAAFPARRPAVEAAAAALGDLYATDVWPSMKITWGTYPTFLGHDAAPGCFRCHDEEHKTDDGQAISQDCALCHALLAQDEKDPRILKELQP